MKNTPILGKTAVVFASVLPFVAAFTLGCSDDPTPKTTPEPPLPPCTNLVYTTIGANDDVPQWKCPLADLCPEAQYFEEPMPHFADQNAARCILEKLRDRTIAKLSYWHDTGFEPGQYSDYETIYIVDSEHGLSDIYSAFDLSSTKGTNNRALLAPVSYFEECLTHNDDESLLACIRAWSSGCVDVAVKCP